MANQITAETETKKKRRDSAGEVPGEEPQAPKILNNLATDSEFQRVFTDIKVKDRKLEEANAKARAIREEAKAEYDAAMTDAVDVLKSRGIKKHVLRDILAISKRKEADIRQDFEAQVWAMRAAGLPIGKQLVLFDESVATQEEALQRAAQRGRDDYAAGKAQTDSPYGQNGPAAQAYLGAFTDAMNENIMLMKKT